MAWMSPGFDSPWVHSQLINHDKKNLSYGIYLTCTFIYLLTIAYTAFTPYQSNYPYLNQLDENLLVKLALIFWLSVPLAGIIFFSKISSEAKTVWFFTVPLIVAGSFFATTYIAMGMFGLDTFPNRSNPDSFYQMYFVLHAFLSSSMILLLFVYVTKQVSVNKLLFIMLLSVLISFLMLIIIYFYKPYASSISCWLIPGERLSGSYFLDACGGHPMKTMTFYILITNFLLLQILQLISILFLITKNKLSKFDKN